MVLGPGDTRLHRPRGKLLVVEPQPLHRRFDEGQLIGFVIDGKVLAQRPAQRCNVAPQQPYAERVKGGDHGLQQQARPDQLLHSRSHLLRRLISEGDRQDGIRRCADVFNQVSNAVSDGARLAAARPGEYQHRALDGLRRLALLGV